VSVKKPQIRKRPSGRVYCTGHCWACDQKSECPGDHWRDKDRDDRAMERDDGREARSINYDNDRGVDE
jgi:hypothetical protein